MRRKVATAEMRFRKVRSGKSRTPDDQFPSVPICSNFALMLGLFLVSFLMLRSSALLFASLRLFSAPVSASFIFWRCSMDLSNSSISFWNFSLASL